MKRLDVSQGSGRICGTDALATSVDGLKLWTEPRVSLSGLQREKYPFSRASNTNLRAASASPLNESRGFFTPVLCGWLSYFVVGTESNRATKESGTVDLAYEIPRKGGEASTLYAKGWRVSDSALDVVLKGSVDKTGLAQAAWINH